jgi:hypothetical protein
MKAKLIFPGNVLALRAQVANDTIYKFLSGERWPRWKKQRAIIKALSLDPKLFDEGDPGKSLNQHQFLTLSSNSCQLSAVCACASSELPAFSIFD